MVILEQFMQPEVRPFAVAALMIALVGGLEVAGMVVGMSFSELFGHALDFGHGGNDSSIVQVLSWINVGSVPLMICILLALGIFSISGFLIQDVARMVAMPLPATAAGVLAAVVSVPYLLTSEISATAFAEITTICSPIGSPFTSSVRMIVPSGLR